MVITLETMLDVEVPARPWQLVTRRKLLHQIPAAEFLTNATCGLRIIIY
jgi:hypothetical protein